MKKIFKLFILFTLIFGASCSESWLDEKPPHFIGGESLYTNLSGFEAGLNGLYSLARGEREGRDRSSDNLFADIAMLGTDNYVPNARGGIGWIALNWGGQNSSTNSNLRAIFLWLYKTINAANTIINQAESNPDIDWTGGGHSAEENKLRIIAEAKAIRAWAYRHLTFCWGDVPLNLEEIKGSNIRTDWTREPVSLVREQMKSDWLYAEKHLTVEPSLQGRITKGAVQHYLSELYLTIGQSDSALIWANECINTPEYKLITERYGVNADKPGVVFMDMFQNGNANREEGNTEALWVFQFEYLTVGGGGSIMRRYHNSTGPHSRITVKNVNPLQFTVDRGGRGIGRSQPTKWAIELYETKDDRGSNYAIRKYYTLKNAIENAPSPADNLPIGYNYGDTIHLNWETDLEGLSNAARNDFPYVRKYDAAVVENIDEAKDYKDQPYLRLAETYLLKAEAQMKLNDNAGAAETINVIRRRANASEITASDVTLDFILDERSRELLGEEHRRYTLLRTNKWLERTRAHNNRGAQNIMDYDTLFAIPRIVIDANLTEEMEQNPGLN